MISKKGKWLKPRGDWWEKPLNHVCLMTDSLHSVTPFYNEISLSLVLKKLAPYTN